jgi:hypothetical protein
MNIGGKNTCACGWCPGCNLLYPCWAPPVHTLTTTGTTFEFGTPKMTKWLKSLTLPKYKLHADGSCTKLLDGLGSLGISFGQI